MADEGRETLDAAYEGLERELPDRVLPGDKVAP
jgi:hypothetical protein